MLRSIFIDTPKICALVISLLIKGMISQCAFFLADKVPKNLRMMKS